VQEFAAVRISAFLRELASCGKVSEYTHGQSAACARWFTIALKSTFWLHPYRGDSPPLVMNLEPIDPARIYFDFHSICAMSPDGRRHAAVIEFGPA